MVVLAAPNVTEIEGSQKFEGVTLFGEKEVNVSLSYKVSESMLQNGVEYSTTYFLSVASNSVQYPLPSHPLYSGHCRS